tara:strand:- start:4975 stop:5382 length:408 start_codon:yes stop_codon:yes gene_type:complete
MIVIKKSKNAILKFLLISSISISLIGFVCVALFSSDPETFELHILFVKIGFYSLLFHCLVQTIFIKSIEDFSNVLYNVSLVFSVILFLFVLIMEFGPNPFENNESLFVQVTSQKVIVFSILSYYFFQVRETLKTF